MPVILKNNAFSTLATGATASDTGIVVADGSKFPALSAGEYFYATLVSPAGTTEVIKVTARVGNSLTVVRAQDGSSAASFQVGARVDMRVNVASISELRDEASEISIADAGGYYAATDVEGALRELGGIRNPKDVATLLADTALTYSNVSAGDIVRTRAEGFAYEVAASGASDQHVTTAGGVKLYVKKVNGAFIPEQFGAAGDYYLPNGNINPTPTDDTAAVQACVDAGLGNGGIIAASMYYTTAPILSRGILSIASAQVPSLYARPSLGIEKPYGFFNDTTDMFDTNPANAQSGFHFRGLSLGGGSTTTLFSTSGKTPIGDYFNVDMTGCDTGGFGLAIDGRLGSWLWKIDNCGIGGSKFGYHDIGMRLYQPHGAVIQRCGFGFRNRVDILSSADDEDLTDASTKSGGVATTFRDNAHDFDIAYKEQSLFLINPQNWLIQGNYSEKYDSTGLPHTNGGRGTDIITLVIDHFNANYVPVIRNNYYAAGDVGRLITVKRNDAEDGFFSQCSLEIYENTVNGLGGDFIYHDHDYVTHPGRFLSMPRPRINYGTSAFTVGDPGNTLRFFGNGSTFHCRGEYTSVAHNKIFDPDGDVEMDILRDDHGFVLRPVAGRMDPSNLVGGKIEVSYRWTHATSADFKVLVYDITGSPQKGSYQVNETGTYGAGTITIPYEADNSTYCSVKLENTAGSGTCCDSFVVDIRIVSDDDKP